MRPSIAVGAGAGGGNRLTSDHISDQHEQADAMSMIGKPAQSVSSVSSSTKPSNAPSNAGQLVPIGMPNPKPTGRPLD